MSLGRHRQTAASAARRLVGVTDVSDKIVVRSGLSMLDLEPDIERSVPASAKTEVSVAVRFVEKRSAAIHVCGTPPWTAAIRSH